MNAKNNRTPLQKVKTNWMAYEQMNDKHLPKSMSELKDYRKQQYGIQFMDQYLGGRIDSKKDYCKHNRISTHTLDAGLRHAGSMPPPKSRSSRVDQNRHEQSTAVDSSREQSRANTRRDRLRGGNSYISNMFNTGNSQEEMDREEAKRILNDVTNNISIAH